MNGENWTKVIFSQFTSSQKKVNIKCYGKGQSTFAKKKIHKRGLCINNVKMSQFFKGHLCLTFEKAMVYRPYLYGQLTLPPALLWYRLSSFQVRNTKLRFLAKNQYPYRKLLYFVNWSSCESSTIGHHFRKQSVSKIEVTKKISSQIYKI